MNDDFVTIKSILARLRLLYAKRCSVDVDDPATQITERDIVADIRQSLMSFCASSGHQVHCEIRPAANEDVEPKDMKRLPRIDVVILRDRGDDLWLDAAKKLQDKYRKGSIEARFASVPIRFFHTAIEAKIQSKVSDAKDDIDTLKAIEAKNHACNCFFVLLNARGRSSDHDSVLAYGRENGITVIEHTAQRHR